MVNWNTRDMTLACLASVYRETVRTAFEIVLVDNGSRDGSAEAIARDFPQVRLIAEGANHGFARGNNIAAAAARGRRLLLLNTDTLVLDGAVDRLTDFADGAPDARIWGGRTVFADGSANPTSCWNRITAWSSFCIATGLTMAAPGSRIFDPEGVARRLRDRPRRVDVVSGCFFLIDADLWRDLGGFDERFFMYGEEADLCARAAASGVRPLATPDAAIVHHGGASETKRADTAVYLCGARIGLARRHLPPVRGRVARAMTIFAPWWRASLYGLAARLRPGGRRVGASAHWREVWARRAEWRDGPAARAPEAGRA